MPYRIVNGETVWVDESETGPAANFGYPSVDQTGGWSDAQTARVTDKRGDITVLYDQDGAEITWWKNDIQGGGQESAGGAGGGGEGGGANAGPGGGWGQNVPPGFTFPGKNYPGYQEWNAEDFQKAFREQMQQGAETLQKLVADPQLREIHATMLASAFAPPPNWQDFMQGGMEGINEKYGMGSVPPPRPYPESFDALLAGIYPPRGYNASIFPINQQAQLNQFGVPITPNSPLGAYLAGQGQEWGTPPPPPYPPPGGPYY